MNTKERVTKLEQGQQDLEARLDGVKQSISDQVAQSQLTIIAQLTALLAKRDGKGKVFDDSLNIDGKERAGGRDDTFVETTDSRNEERRSSFRDLTI
ncbi:hypothetical protein GQ457_15G018590 [Hibiscus cannabinus]